MSLFSDFPTIMFLLLMPLQCFLEYFQLHKSDWHRIKIIEDIVSLNLTVNSLKLIEIITVAGNFFDHLVK